jgi:nucleotide-binding universal stress UspA family protein
VLGVTLVGFVLASLAGVEPVWIAAAGALALALHTRPPARELVGSLEPGFLVFVLALGIVVQAAGQHGLADAADALIPDGTGLAQLLAVAAVSALAANLVNNLPATLILLPATAAAGPGAVLAMLVGVNVGPNLTFSGSLATLLWRRVMHAHDEPADLGECVELIASRRHGPLGRHHPPGPPLEAIADEAAHALLEDAAARFGRPAQQLARRGRVEHEVVAAVADADLLILARDGERRPGPKSLGPRARFVVDHAPCRVLLVWG